MLSGYLAVAVRMEVTERLKRLQGEGGKGDSWWEIVGDSGSVSGGGLAYRGRGRIRVLVFRSLKALIGWLTSTGLGKHYWIATAAEGDMGRGRAETKAIAPLFCSINSPRLSRTDALVACVSRMYLMLCFRHTGSSTNRVDASM